MGLNSFGPSEGGLDAKLHASWDRLSAHIGPAAPMEATTTLTSAIRYRHRRRCASFIREVHSGPCAYICPCTHVSLRMDVYTQIYKHVHTPVLHTFLHACLHTHMPAHMSPGAHRIAAANRFLRQGRARAECWHMFTHMSARMSVDRSKARPAGVGAVCRDFFFLGMCLGMCW